MPTKANPGKTETELDEIRDQVDDVLSKVTEFKKARTDRSYGAKDQVGATISVQFKGNHLRVSSKGTTEQSIALSKLNISRIEPYLRWRVTVTPEELRAKRAEQAAKKEQAKLAEKQKNLSQINLR